MVILCITKDNFDVFFSHAPEAIADFEIKLARYDVAIRSVLYHPVGLEYFYKHLEAEYSTENIDFWKACRDFRHTCAKHERDPPEKAKEVRAALAKAIVNTFVRDSAPSQVNLNGVIRQAILDEVKSEKVETTAFNEAENHIIGLMSLDSFNRFKQSPLFQQFLSRAESYPMYGYKDQLSNTQHRHSIIHMRTGSNPTVLEAIAVKKK